MHTIRRILLLSICCVLCFSLFDGFTAVANDNVTDILDVVLDKDGNVDVTFSASENCMLVTALYDTEDRFLSTVSANIYAGSSNHSLRMPKTDKKASLMKCFLLGSSYEPLCDVYTVVLEDPSADVPVWNGTAASSFGGGIGSKVDPYHIQTAEQLAYLAQQVNSGNTYYNSYFILDNDLDLGKKEWTPIGNYDCGFNGSFDGNDHTIRNLSITMAEEFPVEGNDWHKTIECIGLFGSADSSSNIMNLTVGGSIHVDKPNAPDYDDVIAGGIIGLTTGVVKNCHNRCDVYVSVPSQGTYVNAGGVVGVFSWKTALLNGCSNTGAIYGYSGDCTRCGGLAGDCDGRGTVINCWNGGSVTASGTDDSVAAVAGAVCAHTWSAVITNCCNYGTITAGSRCGGILGYQNGDSDDGEGCIVNCWSTDTVNVGDGNTIGYITGGLYYGYIDACYGVNVKSLSACGRISGGEMRSAKTISHMQELCEALNSWVNANNESGEYAEWVIPAISPYPVPVGK